MKFFLNANIPYSALKVFIEFDLTASHTRDLGLSSASDKEIIDYAIKNKSILITKDLEFANPLIYPQELHNGIVIFRLPFYFTASQFVKVLKDFLTPVDLQDLRNSISIVKLGRYRIRKIT